MFANDRAYADLGRLYANVTGRRTSAEEAAFQIAVWEIAYETTAGAYNLGRRRRYLQWRLCLLERRTHFGVELARGFRLGRRTPPSAVIESAAHQDVIYSPVPEPSTYMLMLAGLLATVEISRRKRQRA